MLGEDIKKLKDKMRKITDNKIFFHDYKIILQKVLKLIKDYNFKVCFDSSGGRIKTPFKVSKFK